MDESLCVETQLRGPTRRARQNTAFTRGRDNLPSVTHNLEAFCQTLEAKGVTFDRPYTRIDELDIDVAFFTDPDGTYIELTEGLDNYYLLRQLLEQAGDEAFVRRGVLAPFAVDQAASRCSCGHETIGRAVVPMSMN